MEFKYFNAAMTCTMINLDFHVKDKTQYHTCAHRNGEQTSFSGRVWFCFSKKSKSCPSMNSSTVQNLLHSTELSEE